MLPPSWQGTILTLSILVFLVEDETLIQELVGHALEEGGFAVVKANSGDEAIAMLEIDGTEFRAWFLTSIWDRGQQDGM
jgi:DNA-binding NtrC family response regulator